MKNVLLPTDLTIQSLWPIHDMVKDAHGQKLSIHIVHMLCMPSSICDLFSARPDKPYRAVPSTFTEAYQMMCNKYSKHIKSIQFHFLYGNTLRYVNNFIEANNIDSVYMLTNYHYGKPLPQSIDFTSLLKKCKTTVYQLPLHNNAFSEYQILSALLEYNEPNEVPAITRTTQPSVSFS